MEINKTSGCRVVIINGRPGVGKTTFEYICKDILGDNFCAMRSTVDKIKEVASLGGWDGQRRPKSRKFLSDLKDLFNEYNDLPFKDICRYLDNFEYGFRRFGIENAKHVLFVDDREPEHIERLKNALDATTLLIRRPGDEDMATSNHADQNVLNYQYDYTITNDGTLEDLRTQAHIFLDLLFSKN